MCISCMSNKNEKIFSQCLDEAESSQMFFRHGCIATYGGKVIAKGCNTVKCYSARDDFLEKVCSCHAEINVLRKIYYANRMKKNKLDRIMRRTTLYISRKSQHGNSMDSAPCSGCLKMIKKFKIKKIVFNLDGNYYIMRSKDYYTNHKTHGDYLLESHNIK